MSNPTTTAQNQITVTAGRVGHGGKVHRVWYLGHGLTTSCGADQHRRANRGHSDVREVEGGLEAINCSRCRKSAEAYVAHYATVG